MRGDDITVHRAVRFGMADGSYMIDDPATGRHVVAASAQPATSGGLPVELATYLLANGLGYGTREGRQRLRAMLPEGSSADWNTINAWGASRRQDARPGVRWVLLATLAGVTRAWGGFLLAPGVIFAAVLGWCGADLRSAVDVAAAPMALLLSVAAHEAGHWAAVRWQLGPAAGALIVGMRVCAVISCPRSARQVRVIAVAGPLAGLVAAVVVALIPAGPATAFAAALIALVNVIGLTPLSADGRALLGPWGTG